MARPKFAGDNQLPRVRPVKYVPTALAIGASVMGAYQAASSAVWFSTEIFQPPSGPASTVTDE